MNLIDYDSLDFIKHKTTCKHKTFLLKYLSERFSYFSPEEWVGMLALNRIFLNGNLIQEDRQIFPNDEIICYLERFEAEEPSVDTNYSVLYEDEYLLIVNKPGDIPVHPAGRYRKNNLLSILEVDFSCKLYPCHRLDRETSGVCLFAKDAQSSQKIAFMFQQRKIHKEYRVFVYGDFPEQIVLEGWIEADMYSSIRKKKVLNQKNLPKDNTNLLELKKADSMGYAITRFDKLNFSAGISMLAAFPLTGRIHQIRASLFSYGFPLLGDKIYGRDEGVFLKFIESGWKDEFAEILGHNRQALHAYQLEFSHPISMEKMKIISPIPPDLHF